MSQMLLGAIMGAIAMGFGVVGLFFLRFWRETRDRLFVLFALAFFIMAVNRIGLVFMAQHEVKGDYLYWVRFVAYVLILVAIADKNWLQKRPGK